MKKWMHILLFHSLKFLQILYIGHSFIKIMYKGFHIFLEKFGHFTKNLSNDTEKHVIQRDSWLQLLMIPLLLQHCHRSRQSRLTPMHLPRIFTLFFLGNPWNDPFLTLTPKFYDENCKINVQKTIFSQIYHSWPDTNLKDILSFCSILLKFLSLILIKCFEMHCALKLLES